MGQLFYIVDVYSKDLLEYKKKMIAVKIKTLDDSLKTIPLDDSHNVGQLMVVICLRIGMLSVLLAYNTKHSG